MLLLYASPQSLGKPRLEFGQPRIEKNDPLWLNPRIHALVRQKNAVKKCERTSQNIFFHQKVDLLASFVFNRGKLPVREPRGNLSGAKRLRHGTTK